jgi:hypothetical protein
VAVQYIRTRFVENRSARYVGLIVSSQSDRSGVDDESRYRQIRLDRIRFDRVVDCDCLDERSDFSLATAPLDLLFDLVNNSGVLVMWPLAEADSEPVNPLEARIL